MNLSVLSTVKAVIEVLILWIAYYRVLIFFEGTRAFQVLKGISYLILALLLSQILDFQVLNWLLRNFFSIWIIIVVIIFQNELRSGLARLGQQHLFNVSLGEAEIGAIIHEVADAVYKLSKNKTGCLIVFERKMKLNVYIESGVILDCQMSAPLLQSIFMTSSPIHDGGVVVRGERIAACACLFPLSSNPSVHKTVGTRHRAALGLTEQSDAVVVLASEETGDVAIAFEGRFIAVSNQQHFCDLLKELISPPKKGKK